MSRDMEILAELIKKTAQVELKEENGKLYAILDEPQSPDSMVKIRDLPLDALVIKVDQFRSPEDIFNGTKGECRRADYVIISSEKRCILYIEVKRTKDKWHKIVQQLRGAECFVKYCQEIGKSFWKESSFLACYKHRFVSISCTSISIDKKKTQIDKNSPIHDSPDTAMKIAHPKYILFNRLL